MIVLSGIRDGIAAANANFINYATYNTRMDL